MGERNEGPIGETIEEQIGWGTNTETVQKMIEFENMVCTCDTSN